MAGDAAVTGPAGHKPVDEAADAAAQHFAERPRLAVPAHQRVPVILGRLVVGGTDADVGRRQPLRRSRPCGLRIEQVAVQQTALQDRAVVP